MSSAAGDGADCFSPRMAEARAAKRRGMFVARGKQSQHLWEPNLLLQLRAISATSESRSQPGSQLRWWVVRQQHGHPAFVGVWELPACCTETAGHQNFHVLSLAWYRPCCAQRLPASPAPASRDVWHVPAAAGGSAGKARSVGFHP